MNEIPKQDFQIRLELARDAKDFMDNRAVIAVMGALRAQWINEIESDTSDREKVHELSIKLRTLAAIPAMLRSLMAAPQLAPRGDHVRRSG